jgi:hypothetical protein
MTATNSNPSSGAPPDGETARTPERRHTLITVPDHTGLRFDVRLQGPGETVFLHDLGDQP